MWELCCVITATLYVYFVEQCHPYILLISTKSILYLGIDWLGLNTHVYTMEC